MEITFAQQSIAFLWSLVLGVCLGAFYEMIRIIKTVVKISKTAVFIFDFCFMFISMLCVFLLCVSFLSGYVRLHLAFGCLFGMILFRFTVGRALSKLYCPAVRFVKKEVCKIIIISKKIIKKLLKTLRKVLYNISNRIKLIFMGIFGKCQRNKVLKGNEEKEVKQGRGSAKKRKRHFNRS